MVGFGVGGGEGASTEKGLEFGGGGGAGARVEPVSFVVMEGDKTSFLPTRPGKLEELMELIPEVFGKVKERKKDGSE